MRFFIVLLTFFLLCCQSPDPTSDSRPEKAFTYTQPTQQHRFWKNGYVFREEAAEALVHRMQADSLMAAFRIDLFKEGRWLMHYAVADSTLALADAGDLVIRFMLTRLDSGLNCTFSQGVSPLSVYQQHTSEPYRLRAEREIFEPLGIDQYYWQGINLQLAAPDLAYFITHVVEGLSPEELQKRVSCLGFNQISLRADGRIYPLYMYKKQQQLLAYCPELQAVVFLQHTGRNSLPQEGLLRLALEAIGTL